MEETRHPPGWVDFKETSLNLDGGEEDGKVVAFSRSQDKAIPKIGWFSLFEKIAIAFLTAPHV